MLFWNWSGLEKRKNFLFSSVKIWIYFKLIMFTEIIFTQRHYFRILGDNWVRIYTSWLIQPYWQLNSPNFQNIFSLRTTRMINKFILYSVEKLEPFFEVLFWRRKSFKFLLTEALGKKSRIHFKILDIFNFIFVADSQTRATIFLVKAGPRHCQVSINNY